MTGEVGNEGCCAAEVMNRFINFGVINLYYVPFREVAAAEWGKKASMEEHSARLHIFVFLT